MVPWFQVILVLELILIIPGPRSVRSKLALKVMEQWNQGHGRRSSSCAGIVVGMVPLSGSTSEKVVEPMEHCPAIKHTTLAFARDDSSRHMIVGILDDSK